MLLSAFLLCCIPVKLFGAMHPLLSAVQSNQLNEVRQYLASHNTSEALKICDEKGRSLLEHAAGRGYLEMTRVLISKGASVDYVDPSGDTALHKACLEGHTDVAVDVAVALLEQSQSALMQINQKGSMPLHLACRQDNPKLVSALLAYKAQFQIVDAATRDSHKTPLWLVCQKGFVESASQLLAAGANPDIGNSDGIAPLLMACFEGHVPAVKLLCARRARVNQAHRGGITPLMIAGHKGFRDIAAILLACQADTHLSSSRELGGAQAVHYAINAGHFDIVQMIHNQEAIMAAREIAALKSSVQPLLEEQKQRIQTEETRQHIKQHETLQIFYETLARKLIETFLAYKVLNTGMVTAEKNGLAYKIADGIKLAGDLIPFPGASAVASGVALVINLIADHRERDLVEQIAAFTTFLSELDIKVEQGVRDLTCRYEEQILQLTREGAEVLAECALRRFIEYMRDGNLNRQVELPVQLACSIATFDANQGLFPFQHKAIETRVKNKDWNDKGVFQDTGIRLKDGQRYVHPRQSQHTVYGYRLGTQIEIDELGYVPFVPSPEEPFPVLIPQTQKVKEYCCFCC